MPKILSAVLFLFAGVVRQDTVKQDTTRSGDDLVITSWSGVLELESSSCDLTITYPCSMIADYSVHKHTVNGTVIETIIIIQK